MIDKAQRTLTNSEATKPLVDLYKTTDALVDVVNTYLPPVTTYSMGIAMAVMPAANAQTAFQDNGQVAIYADSVDTSIVEVHLTYYSGGPNFNFVMRENLSSNPATLLQASTIGGSPVVTSRNIVLATYAVGQCVAKANVPYRISAATTNNLVSFTLGINLKIVRGTKP